MVTWHGNHLTTRSTWKSFIQSNQSLPQERRVQVVRDALININCVCVCWGVSQSDLRHIQPSKTRLTGQTTGEKPPERSNNKKRKRGRRVVRAIKASESRSLRILCQRKEREGLVFVRYYRTEQKHLEKVRENKEGKCQMPDQFSLPTDYVLFVVSRVIFFLS